MTNFFQARSSLLENIVPDKLMLLDAGSKSRTCCPVRNLLIIVGKVIGAVIERSVTDS